MEPKVFWSLTKLEQLQFVVKNCNPKDWPRYPFMPLVNHTVDPFSEDYCGFLLASDIRSLGHLKVYVGVIFDANELLKSLKLKSVSLEEVQQYKTMSFRDIKELAEVWQVDE